MAGLYSTWTNTFAMAAHAADVKEGELVAVGTTLGEQGIAKTANPTAGGQIAGVVSNNNVQAIGDTAGVVAQMGVVVAVKVSAAVAVGAEVAAGADRKGVTATSGDIVHFTALQAATAANQIISCLRVGSYVKA